MFFRTGAYDPHGRDGQRLIAHEVVHTVQARGAPASAGYGGMAAGQLQVSQPGDAAEVEADRIADAAMSGAYPVAVTQTAAAIHRWNPFGSPVSDPNALIPVANLIRYVEDVERSCPSDTPDEIISRIRQQYYNGMAFDQLIPDAHTFDNDLLFGRVPRNIFSASSATRDHLGAQADENAIRDNPSPYVVMPDGSRVDLGHMLLGLDALIHPRTSAPYTTYSIANIDPSSFVADLALASVWTTQHAEEGSPRSGAPRTASEANLG